ncbi:hypothetical protein G7Y89_g5527 [Cudoniella acicularis]|uniref:FZ domain-containing protein n=1 Tax=Cudoniella acicularis TaxID=354080 RepID=A0A8H4RMA6_9HELO|nr:hypothetical protein G7Y89_g5527 [Cudoniella acicularis]
MPLPKLSPLQSRLAASLLASVMLLLLYFAFSSPHFAYAADVDSILPEDHNHERLLEPPFPDLETDPFELRELSYEPEFLGFDRGIIGRAPSINEPTGLINNVPVTPNIELGQTVSYIFHNASLFGQKSTTSAFLLPPSLRKRNLIEEDFDINPRDELGDTDDPEDQKLKPRQSSSTTFRTLYVSVNTCIQPEPVDNTTEILPPQLQLYISQSSNNTNPGPGNSPQDMIDLVEGYGLYELNATGDVYIGLYGKNDTAFKGVWNAEIAASIDAPYHYFHNISNPNLALVDSDSASAFLLADNPQKFDSGNSDTGKWTSSNMPFVLFASDANDRSMLGLQNSYCGLRMTSERKPVDTGQTTSGYQTSLTYKLQTGLTKRDESLPNQQFYIDGLTENSEYKATLAIRGNSTSFGDNIVGGGGQVFQMITFRTTSDSNCGVIFNLTFCDNVAYSVPTNPNLNMSSTDLANWYDTGASSAYVFFNKVIAQIPCDTTSSAQYSLAANCTLCETAYKQWLCAVMIPRCIDFSSTETYLQPRAMGQPFPNGSFLSPDLSAANQTLATNGSRVPSIDSGIGPGPYKEILPCDELCYNLVRACPASMGFSCPVPHDSTFSTSYGVTNLSESEDANLTFGKVTGRWSRPEVKTKGLPYRHVKLQQKLSEHLSTTPPSPGSSLDESGKS